MKKLFILLMLVSFSDVFATPMFYWDNQDKLVPAKGCGLIQVENNRFRISNYFGKKTQVTENFRNKSGVLQSHLVNASLVKIIDGDRKKDYEKIEVVGVNKMEGVKPNRWFSERGDEGYLYQRSLLPAEDYILNLAKGTPDVPVGDIRDSVVGTLWHIAAEGTYYKMVCGEFPSGREYIVFRVYSPEKKDDPIALIGVYWDETNIFRSFEALSKGRALRVIPTVLEPTRVHNLLASNTDYIGDLTDMADPNEVIANELPQDEAPTPIEIEEEVRTEADDEEPGEGEEQVIQGGHETVVCIGSDTLNVRNIDLDKVLFSAVRGEPVKVFQGWDGETKKEKEINGNLHTFVKVQFPDREEDQINGWVAEAFVKEKSNCQHVNNNTFIRDHNAKIQSIDDDACCEFPLVKKPTHSYTDGMRRFKAGRSKGKRLHAACDLYRYKYEPALAVGPGTVIRGKYYFYQGTYAIEVVHDGGFIVRYGEITGKSPNKIKQGAHVKMGDRIGYIGKVNSNCCRPMLHFELYSGKGKGSLSVKGLNKFGRRSDLLDPTSYLLKWEDGKF